VARPLRICIPGAVYHVIARGNTRDFVFLDDADRIAFLDVLARVVERFGCVCHAYCLMGNHYHLVLETPLGNLSAGMRQLNGLYAQYFNRRHGRCGHLFQGRFRAILVEKETYLLAVARYVVRNPVRAGLCREAGEWQWSSYRATAGHVECPSFLCTDWLLSRFAPTRRLAQARYDRERGDLKPLREKIDSSRGKVTWMPAGLSVCCVMMSAPWSNSAFAASASLAGSNQEFTQTILILKSDGEQYLV